MYEDYLMNSDLIEKNNKKNKAIIPVHWTGNSKKDIIKIAKKYNLLVIEDSAQSMGAFYNDKHEVQLELAGQFHFIH